MGCFAGQQALIGGFLEVASIAATPIKENGGKKLVKQYMLSGTYTLAGDEQMHTVQQRIDVSDLERGPELAREMFVVRAAQLAAPATSGIATPAKSPAASLGMSSGLCGGGSGGESITPNKISARMPPT